MSAIVITLVIICFVQQISLVLVTKYYSKSSKIYKELKEYYKKERDEQLSRRIDLETALLWWVNECMKDYSDKQYGKGKLKELIQKDKLVNLSEVSK